MKRRVLVVDDDELTLEILRTILDLEDFEVRTATSGQGALDEVDAERPDVVVLDVMMPDIDGFEVCARLRGDPATATLPIILLSARDREEDRRQGLDAGATAYLTKPFSPLSLIETLSVLDLTEPGTAVEEPAP